MTEDQMMKKLEEVEALFDEMLETTYRIIAKLDQFKEDMEKIQNAK